MRISNNWEIIRFKLQIWYKKNKKNKQKKQKNKTKRYIRLDVRVTKTILIICKALIKDGL